MTQQIINIGTVANSRNGDPLRTAFTKINTNFSELYTNLNSGANLGNIKISGSTIGTQGEGSSWGDSWLYLDPAGEGWSGISIPSLTAQNNGDDLTIYNNKETSGAIQLLLNDGNFKFRQDNSLQFPDGTIQTTAYTGEAAISKFVAINVNGMVSGSEDGITWTDYDTTLTGINRVAVGPNKIVYIADSSADNDVESLWYADSYDTPPTEVASIAGRDFDEVKYFKSISKFIAVGDDGATPRKPALYYSNDGVTWITSTIDPTYFATFNITTNVSFTDIAENELGFFILSDSAIVGGFFLSDITDTLDSSNHVDLSSLSGDPTDVVYTNSYYFTGWHVFASGQGTLWYYNQSANPKTGTFDADWIDVNAALVQEIGISSSIQEIVVGDVYGMSTVAISTSDGQIVYWPSIPAGPFVSVPKPYTTTITGWTSSVESVVSWTNVTGGNQGTGEKFTVTGSSVADYNGTYYIGNNGAVFTDRALTTPLDTTGLDPYAGSATIAWSNGQYIDALHYNNGVFYAGNDDMEMFKSTDGCQTWTQVDELDAGTGGEPFLNDIDSYISTGAFSTGDITFSGLEIRGIPAEMKYGLIKLVPSPGIENHSFLDYGQYVQIYPTNQFDAPHIHIAAGYGAGSEGDLFLGDDSKYVQINHDGNVSIQSYNPDTYNTYRWEFGNDGRTKIPHGSNNPSTARGALGDKAGMILVSGAYLYYCYADYTDGQLPIWQKVAMDNTDWD